MLKFNSLSMSQKKAVVALIEHTPAIAKTGRVTLKDVIAITQDLAKNRTAGGVKIGYPNWLFKSNKVERGIYQLPVPTDAELSAYTKDSTTQSTPKVKAAAKKLVKAKVIKVKKSVSDEDKDAEILNDTSRLTRIINDSVPYDEDVEDFNRILAENGINVN